MSRVSRLERALELLEGRHFDEAAIAEAYLREYVERGMWRADRRRFLEWIDTVLAGTDTSGPLGRRVREARQLVVGELEQLDEDEAEQGETA